MSTGWWSINLLIAILAAVLVGSLAVVATMLTVTEGDYDELTAEWSICTLPLGIGFIIFSTALLAAYLPYRGTGRRKFEVKRSLAEERVEAFLEEKGVKFQKDVHIDQIRRDKLYHVTFHLQVEGRDMSVVVRGRDLEKSSMVFVSPWRRDEALDALVDRLEKTILD
jgi:hypothetical protein